MASASRQSLRFSAKWLNWWAADHGFGDVGTASRYADWRFIAPAAMITAALVFSHLMESVHEKEEEKKGEQSQ